MDVYALFTDGTAEKIIMDTFPKKDSEKGLIIRTTISSQNLKESVMTSVENTFILLNKHLKDIPSDIALCIYGFSNKVLGNSADLAFAVSFAAFLVENKIIHFEGCFPTKIAATGMIDERLNIRSIKGIKAKFIAAIEAGAKSIYFPYENLQDIEEIKLQDRDFEKEANKIQAIPVKTLEEVFSKLGIIGYPNTKVHKSPLNTSKKFFPLKLFGLIFAAVITALLVIVFYNMNSIFKKEQLQVFENDNKDYETVQESVTPIPMAENKTFNLKAEAEAFKQEEEKAKEEEVYLVTPPYKTISPEITKTYTPEVTQKDIPTYVPTNTTNIVESTSTPLLDITKKDKYIVNISGNLPSNIINSGFVAYQGEYIYYTGNLDVGIYKALVAGNEKIKLRSDLAACINVVGDRLYFTNKKNSNIYKMNTDGTSVRKLNNDDVELISVVGEWIYYLCASDKKIYKVNSDGFDRTPLCNGFYDENGEGISNLVCKNLNVESNWIYFSAEFEEDASRNGIYKMRKDGSNKERVSSGHPLVLSLDNNYLYYISKDDKLLYKISKEGKDVKKIVNTVVTSFVVSDGWIYYSNNEGIFKIHSSGDFSTKICEDAAKKINIIEDWIFYFNSNDGNRLYRIRTNGKDKQFFE